MHSGGGLAAFPRRGGWSCAVLVASEWRSVAIAAVVLCGGRASPFQHHAPLYDPGILVKLVHQGGWSHAVVVASWRGAVAIAVAWVLPLRHRVLACSVGGHRPVRQGGGGGWVNGSRGALWVICLRGWGGVP
jgi:hypothetical protein